MNLLVTTAAIASFASGLVLIGKKKSAAFVLFGYSCGILLGLAASHFFGGGA